MNNNKEVKFINSQTLPPSKGYSHVVEVKNVRTIYVSGQIALDKDGQLIGAGDLAKQTKQVFENINSALLAAGVSFNDVIKLTFFVVDISQMQVIREIRDQYVNTDQPPASSAVEVRRLIRDDLLVEIEAIAIGDL